MRLPKEGGWVMIRQCIPVTIPIDPLSIYFAKAEPKIVKGLTIGSWDETELTIYAIIHTPWGDVKIREDEYVVVAVERLSNYFDMVKDGHAFLKHYSHNGKKGIESERLADGIFYLQSRGISYGDALGMCLGLIDTYDLLYIEMHEEYQKMFVRNFDVYKEKKKSFFADREAGIPYMEADGYINQVKEKIKRNKSKAALIRDAYKEKQEDLEKELAKYLGI